MCFSAVCGPFVAQRGQLPLRGLRRHAVGEFQPGRADRFQQRLIEEFRVQLGHPQVLVLDLLAQHPRRIVPAVGPDVGGAGQPAHRLVVVDLGQQMGALEPLQLQPVLEQPEELVGGGQVRRILATDVAALAQRRQRIHRGGDVQRLVAAAMHQLQQLHGELDVAQSAAAEFDLAGRGPRRAPAAPPVAAWPALRPRNPHARRRPRPSASTRPGSARRARRRPPPPGLSTAPGTPRSWPSAGSRRRATRPCGPAHRCGPPAAARHPPAKNAAEATRIISPATRAVVASACSATKMTSTSLT